MRARMLVALGIAAACGKETPSAPTWADDVQPILAANCVRCHGPASPGSAPRGFRLDTLREQTLAGDRIAGQHVYGAAQMSEFIAIRAVEHGTMPPIGPALSDRQKDILATWAERVKDLCDPATIEYCPPEVEGTVAPPIVTLDAPATADGGATLEVRIESLQRAQVTGALVADGPSLIVVTDSLHGGRNVVNWDTGVVAAGTYMLGYAPDVFDPFTYQALGQIDVDHGGGNTAPLLNRQSVVISFQRGPDVINTVPFDEIYVDAEAPYTIDLVATDADGDPMTIDVDLVRGADTIVIADDATIGPGGHPQNPILWDPAGAPASTNWRMRFTLTDGTATRTVLSEPIVVSHATTTETCASMQDATTGPLVKCIQCHGPFGSEDARVANGPDFSATDVDCANSRSLRGLIFRRAVQKREMPPPSALGSDIGGELLTDAERARLENWLLAGAPL